MGFTGRPAAAIDCYEGLAADNSKAVHAVVAGRRLVRLSLGEHGITVTGHQTLKTVPRGYPKDHPRAELPRCKGLVAWQEWPAAAWLGTVRAKDRVAGFFRVTRPLCHWLAASVGESQLR